MNNPFYLDPQASLVEPCYEIQLSITLKLPIFIQPEILQQAAQSIQLPIALQSEILQQPAQPIQLQPLLAAPSDAIVLASREI
jgi:bifunctional DNase/RNase